MSKVIAVNIALYIMAYVCFFKQRIVAVMAVKSFDKKWIDGMANDREFRQNTYIVGSILLIAAIVCSAIILKGFI